MVREAQRGLGYEAEDIKCARDIHLIKMRGKRRAKECESVSFDVETHARELVFR